MRSVTGRAGKQSAVQSEANTWLGKDYEKVLVTTWLREKVTVLAITWLGQEVMKEVLVTTWSGRS
jgi:hypothetical protein